MTKEEYLEFLDEGAKIQELTKNIEFSEREKGWLVNKTYSSPEEVIEDIAYITTEYEKERLDATELDAYFYKRRWLQNKLDEFYADKFVLVDDFNEVQKEFKYHPGAEEVISELASDMDCYVVLKRGDKYFAEVGDKVIDLGPTPDISKIG